ncbi:Rieske (2Fe-2S) protein [Nocardioides zeicaulis]|uniref:Cytochrome bc1 complex Rieske iron-sulfur subunit n=1 Tax=Nocardioides zeicaulis TaxID=1776857 RepID=A0ABV6DWH3_9ACTN
MTAINRRRALTGTAAVAAGVPLLAACGGSDDGGDTASDPSGSGAASSDGGSGDAAPSALATTADVPVGGCFVVEAAKVVVTQPTEGDFKAFSAICTHQGCAVQSSTVGDIPCPCHGSKFSLEDGSVLDGPATSGLEAVEITVDGDSITKA